MQRVANVKDGYVLREQGVPANLAATVTFRTREERARGGVIIRIISEVWSWPYENPSNPGVVAGTINHGPTGLRFPIDCPENVRKDVRTQLADRASGVGGRVGNAHVYLPLITGEIPS